MIKKVSSQEILFHILFWLIHIGYRWAIILPTQGEIIADLMLLSIKMAITYFTVYYLFFRLLLKKKNYQFIVFSILSFIVVLLLRQLLIVYVIYPYELVTVPDTIYFFDWYTISKSIAHVFPVVILALVITLIRMWYQEQIDRYKLSKENLESELKYLKAQIHPHFLFNTINNIYASSLKKNEQTSNLLLKLSDLMRYMIYESKDRLIPISKEIQLLNDYIELEKIRYGNQLKVTFNYSGDINNKEIPPLLFLPFVENSFKHGAAESLEENWISISLEVHENNLTFKVENSKPEIEINSESSHANDGFGLKNLEKRLKLLFKDKYVLKIYNEERSFLSVLKLDLARSTNEKS